VVLFASCATAELDAVDAPTSEPEVDGTVEPSIDAAPGDDAIGLGCSLSPQSGCQSGTACDLDLENLSTGGTECRDVLMPGREVDLCTYLEDCEAGFACIGDAVASSCLSYCRSNADCVAPGGACVISIVDAFDNEIPGATLCSQNCDYMTHGGCPAGWGCHLYRNMGGLQYSACDTAGAAGQAMACADDKDCLQGFSCYTVTETGGAMSQKCLQHCRVTAPASTCATGACTGGTTPIMMGGVEYGACL
jgi:hypothetical protein